MDYDKTSIAKHYNQGRRISPGTMTIWMEAITRHISPESIKVVADIGCGTGRFSEALAGTMNADVIGIEPAKTMLTKGREKLADPRVRFHEGSAENLPMEDCSADLVFLSMVYHHLSDPVAASREFMRILRPCGFVVIRNSTVELLDRIPYLRYFPAAREVNRNKLPFLQNVIQTMNLSGFVTVIHDVIEQPFAESFEEYCEKLRHRALSDLTSISDEDFSLGIANMENILLSEAPKGPIIEPIDLLVFKKPGEQGGGGNSEQR